MGMPVAALRAWAASGLSQATPPAPAAEAPAPARASRAAAIPRIIMDKSSSSDVRLIPYPG
jgi:hypothetical protein